MPSQPLQPFHPPTGFPMHLTISTGAIISWLLAAALLFWAVYTLVAIYHWVKFSHAAMVAYPAIATHVAVSAVILLFALSTLIAGLL